VEVLVDADRAVLVAADEDRLLPPGPVSRDAGRVAAAQQEQVGDHLGAGGAFVCAAGQPDRGDQLGQRGDLAAGRGIGRVHRPVRTQHRDHTAGPGQLQRLDDEVVVHAVPGRVVHLVVQHRLGERHVADAQIEEVGGQPGVGERLRPDLGVRIQRGGDRRGGRVELHTDQPPRGVRRQAQERAGSAAGFEHPPGAGGEAGLGEHLPHHGRQGGVGVVRVERGAGRGLPTLLVEQLPQLGPFGGELRPGGVEHRGHRAPPGPARQDRLLLRGGRSLFGLDRAQYPQRGQVDRHLGLAASRGEIGLAARPERKRG
jgi:hypothetical protein